MGEHIRPLFHENSLAIYARHATISAVLSQIDGAMKSQVSRKILASHLREADLQKPVLRALERITGTALDLRQDSKKAMVSLAIPYGTECFGD